MGVLFVKVVDVRALLARKTLSAALRSGVTGIAKSMLFAIRGGIHAAGSIGRGSAFPRRGDRTGGYQVFTDVRGFDVLERLGGVDLRFVRGCRVREAPEEQKTREPSQVGDVVTRAVVNSRIGEGEGEGCKGQSDGFSGGVGEAGKPSEHGVAGGRPVGIGQEEEGERGLRWSREE